MSSTEERDSPSATATHALPVRPAPSSQPTSFTSHRPPALTTTTTSPPANHSASSSSPSTSSSPDPLLLSPSDLSSVITLKHNYDTLTTQHSTLLTTLAQRDTQLSRLHSQHKVDEAEWEQWRLESREQYERVMRDWSEESDKRRRVEESERRWKQQLEEITDEQRRRERTTRLLEADLANEHRMSELLREKVQQLDQQLAQLTTSASDSSTAHSAADGTGEDEADTSLLSVHKAVLSRRVQRLEMELTAANEQLAHQQAINTQQLTTLNDINTHLTALNQQLPTAALDQSAVGSECEGGVGVMAEVECVVLRERLRCERRNGWRQERRLYCFVLLWLLALMTVSIGGLLFI